MKRVATVLVFWSALILPVAVSPASAVEDPTPPVVPLLPVGRSVELRNETGGLSMFTSIPSGSAFATYGEGPERTCSYPGFADPDGAGPAPASDGPHLSKAFAFYETTGSVVTSVLASDWEALRSFSGSADIAEAVARFGPVSGLMRRFNVYCVQGSGAWFALNTILVGPTDPILDPHKRLTNLYNDLQLEALSVYRNPAVAHWGGLVVRSPAWLAVDAAGWQVQKSNPQYYRGWELVLIAYPKTLTFNVNFVPDPERPTPAWSGTVPCVAAGENPKVSGVVPAVPVNLADFAEPGAGTCMWTPPGPGKVTVTATVTFGVTFWVSGAGEPQPDYVWKSPATEFKVGELVVVNING
jgi:hypothetical protein